MLVEECILIERINTHCRDTRNPISYRDCFLPCFANNHIANDPFVFVRNALVLCLFFIIFFRWLAKDRVVGGPGLLRLLLDKYNSILFLSTICRAEWFTYKVCPSSIMITLPLGYRGINISSNYLKKISDLIYADFLFKYILINAIRGKQFSVLS